MQIPELPLCSWVTNKFPQDKKIKIKNKKRGLAHESINNEQSFREVHIISMK